MGGMGAEELYSVKLVTEDTGKATEVEEAEAGDMDDPFAMMGGMGAEELYQVKLHKDNTAQISSEETPGTKKELSDEQKKKLKKVVKEGGKRGVEIEGAADMG